MEIARGQRLKLQDVVPSASRFGLDLSLAHGGLTLDVACFGLDASRKLADEAYMTFFNQRETPCGGVAMSGQNGFSFDLGRLPASIDALIVTLAIDGSGTMKGLGACAARLLADGREVATHRFDGSAFEAERAIMLIEFYRNDGLWRMNAVGQGFNGGLDALIRHFGGTVAESAPAPAPGPSPVEAAKLSLEKRVEKEAPQLVSLVKKAKLSLEKVGLGAHQARVCLCLDISGSMHSLYKSGAVQQFAERILALGCRFDDDGAVDVFLFGEKVHHPEPMTLANCSSYVASLTRRYPLEGDTRYGRAMQAIREFYFEGVPASGPNQTRSAPTPVYVMFVTDGSTSDKSVTERQLRESSREPIFWQFMGIGKGRKSKSKSLLSFADSDFPFLEKLDELDGRLIDNANFFSVARPDEHADDALYHLLMNEYPDWLKAARAQNLIPRA